MDPLSVSIMMAIIGWAASATVSRLLTEAVEGWARISYLGDELDGLKKKLQEITILLDNAQRTNLKNWPLIQSLSDLQQAVYDAEDLLEELDYYRLQDKVEEKNDYYKHVIAKKPAKFIIFRRDIVSVVKKKVSCASTSSVSVQEPQRTVPKLDKIDISRRINDVVKKLDQNGEVISKALSLENLGRIAESLSIENLQKIVENLFKKNNKKSTVGGDITIEQVSRNMLARKLREKERVEIVKHLTNNYLGVENIPVLPIVGNGGVGKTTLAKVVFDDEKVKNYFDERMWLRVSPDLDVENLTLEMIGISNGKQEEVGINITLEDLHYTIQEKLESKKVLLVVDNLCDEDLNKEQWNWLKELFSISVAKGTKILVTTRCPRFAKSIKTTGLIINLDGFKGAELAALFDACAYWDNDPNKFPSLLELRQSIMNKLCGYPLEVKTIGRVLRNKLDFEHWNAVLNSNDWKNSKDKNNDKHIISSLEISYRYLSSDCKKCFSYCSLFPKNFKFKGYDLINLWIAQGFVYSKEGYKSKELGINCLNELVSRGFLEEVKESSKCQLEPTTSYLMHELMHDLARIISSKEVLTIDGSVVKTVSNTIRHVSIITHSAYKSDNDTKLVPRNESFEIKVVEIWKQLKIEKLRSLILIGNYDSNFANIFLDQFKSAKYLRVLRLPMESFGVDSLLYSFSNSLLLRYLKLDKSSNHDSLGKKENVINSHTFPKPVFRLYHLESFDISDWYGDLNFPDLTQSLVSLRCFHAKREQVAMISEIGKLALIEELREFNAQNNPGYDIGQLGKLRELGGSLSIFDLENINSKVEASKANLVGKSELRNLSLYWSSNRPYTQPELDASILKGLKPPPNIRNLDIHEYADKNFPRWMVMVRSLSCLQSLKLTNCSNLDNLPPLGQLPVLQKLYLVGMPSVKEIRKEFYGDCAKKPFNSLGEIVFSDMKNLEKWVGCDECTMFPCLKKLEIINCPILSGLPLQSCNSGTEQSFPLLIEFKVENCPKLVLPPLPHTKTLAKINVSNEQFKSFVLLSSELSLSIECNKQSRTLNQEVLVFSHLKFLNELSIKGCPIACLPWEGFEELSSLKRLIIKDLQENTHGRGKWILPKSLELLEISSNNVTGQQLSEWLLPLTSLVTLAVQLSSITCLKVGDKSIASEESSHESTAREDSSQSEDNSLWVSPGKLQFLKEISINGCEKLVSLLPQNGLRGFTSLKKLTIKNCSSLLPALMGNTEILPPSLSELEIDRLPDNLLVGLLSKPPCVKCLKLGYSPILKSISMNPFGALLELNIDSCRALSSVEDVRSLSSLRQLAISRSPKLASAWKAALQKEKSLNKNFSLPLKVLIIDDTSFLTEELYKYLPTLDTLVFDGVQTQELNEGKTSLVNLTSLREINFRNCPQICSLPNDLTQLSHLSTLKIKNCPQIMLLPDDLPHIHGLHIDRSNCQLEEWCRKHSKFTKLVVS